MPPGNVRLVHINDLHGHLRPEHVSLLREARGEDGLLFDTGDCIRTGNLGVPLKPEACWALMAEASLDAGTIGNRETHVLESAFRAKIAGCQHRLLCANMVRRGTGERVLPASVTLERAGLRVGIFGVSVAMVTERMKTKGLSEFLWTDPIETAIAQARELRPNVDILVALTHIGQSQDRKLAERCPEIDMIFGGHSHTVLEQPERVGQTWIMQGGSHARFMGVYDFDPRTKSLAGGLQSLRNK